MIKNLMITLALTLFLMFPLSVPVKAEGGKPIIVCTTNAVGSLVREYSEQSVAVVVLVQPSLCPADFDMKPSEV